MLILQHYNIFVHSLITVAFSYLLFGLEGFLNFMLTFFNPSSYGGGGHSLVFCPLLKISLGNPYLKTLDLTKLFYCGWPYKKKSKNLVLPPLRAL